MKKEFGATKNGEKASCYVLKNSKGMEAVVSDFGASLLRHWRITRMEEILWGLQ